VGSRDPLKASNFPVDLVRSEPPKLENRVTVSVITNGVTGRQDLLGERRPLGSFLANQKEGRFGPELV
jgi:hypothetical protein